MWFGIALNILLIVSIKYYFRYDEILLEWAKSSGINEGLFIFKNILPLGTSFYTLKKISYLVEVNHGTQEPQRDLIKFGAYVSFFPQVLSGPIDRPKSFIKQLEAPRVWSTENFYNAWQLLIMGVFKKIVIANTVKVFVDQIFLIKEPSKVLLIVGGLGFTLQILADFSSYTDLSRGVSFLLGLKTTENFNKPYLALTPNDFWNRWHISLSSWLRDYIFFPVRRLLLRVKVLPEFVSQILPPLITMYISGLWHGIGSTFIVWGLYYGILIVIYQFLGIRSDIKSYKRFFAWAIMFVLIVFGWIIFRSPSTTWLWNTLLHSPFANNTDELIASLVIFVMIMFYASFLYIKHLIEYFVPKHVNPIALYYSAVILITIIFTKSSSPDFIYFQF
jgi:D-alanyl-lipoteichoic acid acyltransferase DltB (MBOAT superfamily)